MKAVSYILFRMIQICCGEHMLMNNQPSPPKGDQALLILVVDA